MVITTTNAYLITKLTQQEEQIWALQAEICNLKLLAAAQTPEGRGASSTR